MSQIRNTDKTKWSWRPETIRTFIATVSSKLNSHFEKWSERVTYQFSSVNQSCPTLCNPMQCSIPGFPVHHLLSELAQTHIQWCHPTISSSVIPFSSCLQSFLASGSFQMSQSFTCFESLWLLLPNLSCFQPEKVLHFKEVMWLDWAKPDNPWQSILWKWKWNCSVVSDSLPPHGL